MKPSHLIVALTLIVPLLPDVGWSQSESNIEELIDEATDTIQTDLQMQLRGIVSLSGVATSYTNRGQLYLFGANKPAEAEADFLAAIKMLKARQPPTEASELRLWTQAAGDSLVHLALAQRKRGRPVDAVASASRAIRAYRQLVEKGNEVSEPMVVYAVKIKLAALSDLESIGSGEQVQAIEEADLAIDILQKWSSKDDGEFFAAERVAVLATKKTLLLRFSADTSNAMSQEETPLVENKKNASVKSAAAKISYANRPYGVWLNDRVYVNEYFPAMKLALPEGWVRGNAVEEPLEVRQLNALLIAEGTSDVSRNKIGTALVVFAKADYGSEVNTLQVRYRGVQSFTAPIAIDIAINDFRRAMSAVSPVIAETIETRSQVYLNGVKYDFIDTDRLYQDFTLHHRIYFAHVEDQIVSFEWSFGRPEMRSLFDGMMINCVEWLIDESSSGHVVAANHLQRASQAEPPPQEIKELESEIDELVKQRAFYVRQLWSTLKRPASGGFFTAGADRARRFSVANEYYNIAAAKANLAAEKSTQLTNLLLAK